MSKIDKFADATGLSREEARDVLVILSHSLTPELMVVGAEAYQNGDPEDAVSLIGIGDAFQAILGEVAGPVSGKAGFEGNWDQINPSKERT